MKSELNWGQTAIFASFSELKSLPFPAGQVNRPDCTASVFLQNTVVYSSPKRLCTPPPPPPSPTSLGCGQESRNVFLFLYSRNLPKVARKYISYQNCENIAERKKTKCKEWHKTKCPFSFYFSAHVFYGETTQCNHGATNFWYQNKGRVRYATVILRRILTAKKAGIYTGTSCGYPTYNVKDIFIRF